MILRRITEHVKAQNWFAVAIDFLIVVVGVFVGLQVSNWNDSRKDRLDAQIFVDRLHQDIILSEKMSGRTRGRRLATNETLIVVSEVLFGRADRSQLTPEECVAIASTHYFNVGVSDLSSLSELTSTGRMNIIRASQLRTELVQLQKARAALQFTISIHNEKAIDLVTKYPDLIQRDAYFNEEINEVSGHHQCDLEGMQSNQAFLNDAGANFDRYDAYFRGGLRPWSAQLDKIHELVDVELGLDHAGSAP